MMIQTAIEDIAKEIFKIIGVKLQLENEDEAPFAYLGLTADFNGEDIEQRLLTSWYLARTTVIKFSNLLFYASHQRYCLLYRI